MTDKYRWIFFDLDDTLWDFSANSMTSLQLLYDNNPEIRDSFPSFDAFADEYHLHNAPLWERYAAGEIGSDFLKTERFRLTLYPASHSIQTMETCRHLNKEYLETLCSLPAIVKNAEDVLAVLSRHYMIGVISNGFKDTQYKKLYNTNLWRYVARLIISDEIDIRKPDPGIFLFAMQATGADPSSSLMVGDNLETDIKGALNVGLDSVFFTNGKSVPIDIETGVPHSPDVSLRVIDSLSQLPELLR